MIIYDNNPGWNSSLAQCSLGAVQVKCSAWLYTKRITELSSVWPVYRKQQQIYDEMPSAIDAKPKFTKTPTACATGSARLGQELEQRPVHVFLLATPCPVTAWPAVRLWNIFQIICLPCWLQQAVVKSRCSQCYLFLPPPSKPNTAKYSHCNSKSRKYNVVFNFGRWISCASLPRAFLHISNCTMANPGARVACWGTNSSCCEQQWCTVRSNTVPAFSQRGSSSGV